MYRYQKSKVFPVSGIRLWRWMSEVTRGRVDNENNSQSRYLNMSNIVQGGVYIYESENIAIRNRNITEFGSEHRYAMLEHGIGTGTGTGTKLEMVILRMVLVIPEFECGTKFWESRELV